MLSTAVLTPAVQCVAALPGESELVTFTCTTNTTRLSWIYEGNLVSFNSTFSTPNESQHLLGVFTIRLTMVQGNNLTSTATVNVSSLVNIATLNITCDDNDDGLDGEEATLINGTPASSSLCSSINVSEKCKHY